MRNQTRGRHEENWMTLLVVLAEPSGVHQSSDYRITALDPTRPDQIPDEAGIKQLTASFKETHLSVSLTGLAQFGGTRTIDWIASRIAAHSNAESLSSLYQLIANDGSGVDPVS